MFIIMFCYYVKYHLKVLKKPDRILGLLSDGDDSPASAETCE